ncbi:glycosyltransferase 61 family protein [Synechococcus sp. UW140]|uniref:glycosyltransferase family 61 protein n=1 Tax=Synechococcus sp. UW140 TaxID=368503 RepID=UPI003137B141
MSSTKFALRNLYLNLYREWVRFCVFISPRKATYLTAGTVLYSEVSSKILCYAQACKTYAWSPNVDGKQFQTSSYLPDLFFRSIKDSYSIAYSPSLLLKNRILAFPDSISLERENRTRLESFPLVLVSKNSSIYVLRNPSKYSKTILGRVFVVGGSSNWYHLLFEILPKLYLVDKHFGEQPQNIIITRELMNFTNFAAAINLFSSYHNLIVAASCEILWLEEAIIIDDFNIAPLNVKPDLTLHPSDWKINNFMLNEFAIQLRSRLLSKDPPSTKNKKLFLARKNYSNRRYNQDSLIKISREFGFQICNLENYTLSEQFDIISNAQYLVGPPGSAWSSLIFSEKPLKCLSWVPHGRFQFSSLYSTISKILGHDMNFFYSGINTSQIKQDPFFVDPNTFRYYLSKLLMP